MLISAWILSAIFGTIGVMLFLKVFFSGVNSLEVFMLFFSIIVAALSIGFVSAGSLSAFLS